MARSFPFLILILSMIGLPAALHGQTPIPLSQISFADRAEPPVAAGHDGPADPTRTPPAGAVAESGVAEDRFHADEASAAPTDPRGRAAIDHRFAPRGLVGSLGYGHSADSRPIDADAAGPAAASGLGGPGGFVGAWLNYAF